MNARRLLFVAGAPLTFAIIAFAALMRLSPKSVVPERTAELAKALQSLRVGDSHYREAKIIADRYGTVPFVHHWGTSDCADGYFDRCAYQIPVPTTGPLFRSVPWLSAWQSTISTGFVNIWIDDGRVTEYHFTVLFRTAEDQWRGAGVDVQRSFSDTAVQARVSDSYVVARNDVMMDDGRGFELARG